MIHEYYDARNVVCFAQYIRSGYGYQLVIVESPTKAHKIGDYLGKGYTVMASVGHIRDLAQPSQVPAADKAKFGKFGVDVNDGFKPYYIVDGDKKRTVSELKSALKNADELYLATDEDREGEAIAWHLVQTLKPRCRSSAWCSTRSPRTPSTPP